MKKVFTVLILAIIISITAISTSSVAFASDKVTVVYYYGDTPLLTAQVTVGEQIGLPSLTVFCSLTQEKGLSVDTEGKTLEWHISGENGETATSLTPTADVNLYAVLISVPVTVTYTYVYDYIDDVRKSEYKTEYAYGARPVRPAAVCGSSLAEIYSDCALTKIASFPTVAESNLTFYVKLNKYVTVSINGAYYNCAYGTAINEILDTQTYNYNYSYLNEERTVRFTGAAVDGLVLYAIGERTNYLVTLIKNDLTETVLVPVSTPYFYSNSMETEAKKWCYTETVGETVNFPLALTDDITLYGFDDETAPLTKSEIIALSVTGALVLACIACAAAVGIVRKRKRKAFYQNDKPQDGASE